MTDTFEDYHLIKGWNKDEFASSSNSSLLEAYASLLKVYIPGSIPAALDFGFGNGEMLQTLKKLQVEEIYGIEANTVLIELARQSGIKAYNSVSEIAVSLEGKLDVITAMHVMEHIEFGALENLFDQFSKLIRPGGYLIAAFPNGESPFSSYSFHSDPTHTTFLTREKCRILALNKPLALVAYKAFPSISRHSKKIRTQLLSAFREIGESFIYFVLSKFIFGNDNIVMNPVAVAVWKNTTTACASINHN
ncbi:class I SAM-dependent methyltransferase [Oryzomonas rubra]|uniref:Class I SAM-dependent methyltransferase n=1 Tax=Oryzomonas rubra TaxID=2509454 RepID=A0A5A9XGQ9_9BACT|nr:class I SAM-dependent methyltransferase [Oryzomonas rubra]KAA0891239.1 class I SAM-dependent methyltransferase [Oryzomonas rubra]